MQAKRILILTNRIPYPLNDGGNLAMNAMIEGYSNHGMDVYLLSMNTTRHYVEPAALHTLYKNIYAFRTVDVDNDVTTLLTLKNYLFSKLPNHAQRFYDKAFESAVISAISEFNPDIIQVESVFLSEYLPVINANTKALKVLRLHNIEWQIWHRLAAETSNIAKKIYLSNLTKRIREYEVKVFGMYDLLLPITEHDASILRQTIKHSNIYTVHFGIQPEAPATIIEEWDGYHIGAMDWRPNSEAIDWFIYSVWPVIHTELPDFRFHFAGRNMPAKYKYLNVPGVICEGEVRDADSFISDKKMLIVPLRSGGGVRIKILEAMAKEKLVISTAIGMQGIDAVAGVHFLEADDADGFVRQISWALHNKEEANRIAMNARQLIYDRYDSSRIAAGLSERLLSLL